jgi:hypothetical protein
MNWSFAFRWTPMVTLKIHSAGAFAVAGDVLRRRRQ